MTEPRRILTGLMLSAVSVAAAQIVFYPLLVYSLGWTSQNVFLVLSLMMSGFCLGSSGALPLWAERAVLAGASGFCLLAALFYRELTGDSSLEVKALFAAGSFFALAAPGILFCAYMYGADGHSQSVYRRINLLSAFSVLFFCGALYLGGFRATLAVLSLYFGLTAAAHRGISSGSGVRISVGGLVTFLLSMATAGYTVGYFELTGISLAPIGLELPAYLFLVFAALGLSRYLKLRASSVAVFAGFLVFFLIVPLGPYVFRLLPGCGGLSCGAGASVLQWAAVSLLVFVPYLFFAALVPLRQEESPGTNHLFYSSLGNLAGFALFSGALGGFAFQAHLLVMLVLAVAALYCLKRAPALPVLLAVTGLAALYGAGSNPVEAWIKEGHRARNAGKFYFSAHGRAGTSSSTIRNFVRRSSESGYIVDYGFPLHQRLGLKGYLSPFHSVNDQFRALVSADLAPKQGRILVLGLGSHLALATLRKALDSSGKQQVQIEVIDNFPPFQDEGFREGVGRMSGFSWKEAANVKFIPENAVSFVLSAEPGSYDLILWNLTLPQFGQFNRIYTLDYMLALRRAIREGGSFVGNDYPDPRIRCLFSRTGSNAYLLFAQTKRPMGAIITGERRMDLPAPEKDCGRRRLPTFDRPFLSAFIDDDRIKASAAASVGAGLPGLGLPLTEKFLGALSRVNPYWAVDHDLGRRESLDLNVYSFPGYVEKSAMLIRAMNPNARILLNRIENEGEWERALSGFEPGSGIMKGKAVPPTRP